MPSPTLRRQRRDVYATDDHRFVLERRVGQWVLMEQGRLIARKQFVLRTHRRGNNSATEAIRWAHPLVRGERPIASA
jgi:hypothetical protein